MDQQPHLLWSSFRQGSMPAFEALYQLFYQPLYTYGMQVYSDSDMVRDAIQSLFIDLWRRKEMLSEPKNVKFYLFRALRRKLISLLNEERKLTNIKDYQIKLVEFSPFYDSIYDGKAEQKEKLKKAVDKLSKKQREVIFLRYYENMSCEEIADIMQININTVYNNISLAIRNLRLQLDNNLMLLLISTIPGIYSV